MKALFGNSSQNNEEDWISISDLMAGLMVIFLFIAITYIRPVLQSQEKIKDIVVAWNNSEIEIYRALEKEFKHDLARWNAELDRETLTIRFQAPDILFDQAQTALKPGFEAIIADFFPRYIDVLFKFRDFNIGEFIIELECPPELLHRKNHFIMVLEDSLYHIKQ